ncbi:MarR family transcriptional regulator [Verticiella sediminum]|uniref:MarR family transcriptional regulator n=1 Tax=Verticiella sediminum TaxID=1247510 RepID=A0A556B1M9_9BURK|nr:helix-turn-helix domain-containing protein [Verticiella sediminum]TSH98655.1 MarR family transcriptional regulator [Verticiella sediminum]
MIDQERINTLRAARATGIGRMLLLARRDFLARVQERLASGGASLPPSWAGLLPYIDIEGTRSTVLAQRAGISKQVVAKVVKELEALGLLERSPDKGDGRAFLVCFTELGLERLLSTHEAITEIEHEYEALLGARKFGVLREALFQIAYGAQPHEMRKR